MIKIGITGGIGSGKSIVCECFKLLEIPVFNSDIAAKEILADNLDVQNKLRKLLGSDIFISDNEIDKAKLAARIFTDKNALEKVNEIIHPEVRAAFLKWSLKQKSRYVIQESALIFETGLYKHFDKIISVIAPIQIRTTRVMKRDNLSIEKINERIANQSTDDEKLSRSDFVITNDNIQLIFPQVLTIHHEIIKIC